MMAAIVLLLSVISRSGEFEPAQMNYIIWKEFQFFKEKKLVSSVLEEIKNKIKTCFTKKCLRILKYLFGLVP